MTDFPPGFGSDNHAGVHPKILAAIGRVNEGHAPSYETDQVSASARETLRRHFGATAEPFFVFNGTAANVLALRAMIDSFQSVLCAEVSHLNVDECGAPEKHLGSKLVPLKSVDGKISVEEIKRHLVRRGDQHACQPRVVSITQPTELGTMYSLAEMREISALCRQEGLLLHVDGARLVNAAARLGVGLAQITAEVGVDALSFGGTKNGLLFGEAVVFFRPELAKNFVYHRKQGMQLVSKTRFVAAQFNAWLEDGLWLEIASHANAMADLLRTELEAFSFIEITRPTQSNAVFACIPKALVSSLRSKYFFYVWNEETFEARLMTSFATRPEDIHGFGRHLREVAQAKGWLI